MQDEDQLEEQLEALKNEHRELDSHIQALIQSGQIDFMKMQRMKKRKLQLKDQIEHIRSSLLPDIIA